MAKQWRGLLHEYADRLNISDATPIITLGEGGTRQLAASLRQRHEQQAHLVVWQRNARRKLALRRIDRAGQQSADPIVTSRCRTGWRTHRSFLRFEQRGLCNGGRRPAP